MVRQLAAALLCVTLCTACSKKPPADAAGNGGTAGSGEHITGRERFSWNQSAVNATGLAEIRYVMYVDGNRVELSDVRCDSTSTAAGFACNAPLPRLTTGSHVLQLASFIVAGGSVFESPRSAPLVVTLGLPSQAVTLGTLGFKTRDGTTLHLEAVADDLAEPTDVAFTADGRAFIAEAGATVRILPAVSPAAAGSASIASSPGDRLLALTLDPAFADNHHVFALLVTPGDPDASTFMLARFREQAGAFVDRVVILDNVPAAAEPRGSIRFGPDAKLYVTLDDGGVPARAGDLASRNGKLLRMNADGTTPDDQVNLSPVYAYGFRAPRALIWQPSSGGEWLADENAAQEPLLYSLIRDKPAIRGRVRAAFRLPPGTSAAAAMFYRGRQIAPFENNLFVVSNSPAPLLRFTFVPGDPQTLASTEPLLDPQIGAVRLVAQAPDGSMYIGTTNGFARVVVAP